MIRTTHTYVELEISEAAYKEIRSALYKAEYFHCFPVSDWAEEGTGPIDLSGIAVIPSQDKTLPATPRWKDAHKEKPPLDTEVLGVTINDEMVIVKWDGEDWEDSERSWCIDFWADRPQFQRRP